LPIIIRSCSWQTVDWLSRIQVLPKDGKALNNYKNSDEAIEKIVQRIVEVAEIVAANKENFDGSSSKNNKIKLEATVRKRQEKGFKVFISHENDDGDFAEVLKLKLEKAAIDAWIDVNRLRVGYDWRQEIDDAIRNSSAVIAVMTPLAKESEYVTYE